MPKQLGGGWLLEDEEPVTTAPQQTLPQNPPITMPLNLGGGWALEDDEAAGVKQQAMEELQNKAGFGTLVSEFGKKVNPIPGLEALATIAEHPETAGPALKGMLSEQGKLGTKAIESLKSGDYIKGMRQALHFMIPLLGPELEQAGEEIEKGNYAAGAGQTLGIAANVVGPKAIAETAGIGLNPLLKVHPERASAVAWAEHGAQPRIDLPASAQSGGKFAAGMEKRTGASMLGSGVATEETARLEKQLAGAGRTLAEKAYKPAMMTPETAAEGVSSATKDLIKDFRDFTTQEYKPFNQALANPANKRTMQIGTKQVPVSGLLNPDGTPVMRSVPVMTDPISMPVDMRPYRPMLKDIHDDMMTSMSVAQREHSTAFEAVKNLMNGDDFISAKVAEDNIGALKSVVRGEVSPDARNVDQGMAAFLVGKMEKSIDDAVLNTAGPKVVTALHKGRTVAATKARVVDTLKKFQDEPVGLYRHMVQPGDAGINFARNVALYTPKELPKVARAFIEGMLDNATAMGGFRKAGELFEQWRKLGPETKKLLFKPELEEELNNFFKSAKYAGEYNQGSPTALIQEARHELSGLAKTGVAGGVVGGLMLNPVATGAGVVGGVGYILANKGIAKLLMTPQGVALLKKGFRLPLRNTAGAAALTSQILRMAGEDARPYLGEFAEGYQDHGKKSP